MCVFPRSGTIVDRLLAAQASQTAQFNKHRSPPPSFQVGHRVLLLSEAVRLPDNHDRPKKLSAWFCGPFTILDVDPERDNVKLDLADLSKAHEWFHVDKIALYHAPNEHFSTREHDSFPAPEIDAFGDEQYEIDHIIQVVDPSAKPGSRWFLV
ncbi:hypothetical protein HK105_209258 [Polyrhizophydium stewartii]|uniref:Uncharacterized protein n=1 Tax=Polyrhizophydium stewartii TaxID=2732419 RepID=A0ABR4MVJ1_9FUNG